MHLKHRLWNGSHLPRVEELTCYNAQTIDTFYLRQWCVLLWSYKGFRSHWVCRVNTAICDDTMSIRPGVQDYGDGLFCRNSLTTVYPKKYAHGFCFAVLCCGYTLTDFPISIRLTSLALWQSNDCPSASKETLMNMDEYFMWIHYERLHNHNKAKHNKTVCIFLGMYCTKLS